jgi:Cu/Ag efflux protein CusF
MMSTRFIGIGLVAVAIVAVVAVAPLATAAQKPVSSGDVVSRTFTIEAIDNTNRVVTLKGTDGYLQEVYCGPEVQRFDALKVGDTVTFRYHESVVSALRRPGQAPRPAEASGVTRTPGSQPGATVAQQMTRTVTITAIDPKAPSVTIRGERGAMMSFRVMDAKNLEGYKVGDTVEITYTQALAIRVEPAKK